MPKKGFDETLEELNELFPYEGKDEIEKFGRKIGTIFIRKSYPTPKNKINLSVVTLPSQDKLYAELDGMANAIAKKMEDARMSDEEKKEALKQKEELELKLEKSKAMYRRLRARFRAPKEESLYFMLRCEPMEGKKTLDLETLWRLPQPIKQFLGIVEKTSPEFIPTRSCLQLTYDSKKYKFVGGFSLPTKIPLSPKVVERLGEAEVSGFHLSFKESPLNINRIEIRLRRGEIGIFAEFSAKMHVSEKVYQEVYEYGVRASSLFVEAIN